MNNGTPVTIVAHSMGGPMTLLFFQRMTKEWKNIHIKRFITLAGAWAGSVKAVKVFAMGLLSLILFLEIFSLWCN